MDESVIKVLRRNGSWKQGQDKSTLQKVGQEEDFVLDDKFGILAEEIKKRMMQKANNSSLSMEPEKSKRKPKIFKSEYEDKFNKLKKQMLPYLTEVEKLVYERDLYLKKIYGVDERLETIRKKIITVKEKYESDLAVMKKNINFFNDSLEVINSIKEKK